METRELMWLELMKYHGLAEIPGSMDNATIVAWFKEMSYPEIQDDETSWCSLTLNIMAKHCGLEHLGKLTARSWMQTGIGVSDPKIGHIVVFWREKKTGWKGHVGLFAGWSQDKKQIFTLGGNQNNQIGIRAYPVAGFDFGLLGFREINYV